MPLIIGDGVNDYIHAHQMRPTSDEVYLPPDFDRSVTGVIVADSSGVDVVNVLEWDKATGQVIDLRPPAGITGLSAPTATAAPGGEPPIIDIIGQLPHNGSFPVRLLSGITILACHYDGSDVPDEYDPLALYTQEANYHIAKDWGGGAHGYGLEYHYCVSRIPDPERPGRTLIYKVNPETALTWNATNANSFDLAVKFDSGPDTPTTPEQRATGRELLDWLCFGRPDIPATRSGVYGHGELTEYGNATDCPGPLLPWVQAYRAGDVARLAA